LLLAKKVKETDSMGRNVRHCWTPGSENSVRSVNRDDFSANGMMCRHPTNRDATLAVK